MSSFAAPRPLFSILLPSHNGLSFVKLVVESVLTQSTTSWELIISDNCSEEDYRGYLALMGYSRIRLIRPKTQLSRTDNWNHALAHATGEYVIVMEDGDALAWEGLATLKALTEEHAQPDAIFSTAYHYVYPGVLQRRPRGYLATVTPSPALRRSSRSSELSSAERHSYAEQGLRFRRAFGFNSQFMTWKKSFIDSLAHFGPFFQSPCPHYYSSLVTMRIAPRVIMNPEPCIIIGTSLKSCGLFDSSGETQPLQKGSDASDFHADAVRSVLPEAEEALQLPCDPRYRNWLVSNLTAYRNLRELFPKRVNLRRYRTIQILWMAHRHHAKGHSEGVANVAAVATLSRQEQRLFKRFSKVLQSGKRARRSLQKLHGALFDDAAYGGIPTRIHHFGTHTDVLDALIWLSVRHRVLLRLLQAIPRRVPALRRRMRGERRQAGTP